jgi:biofilm protein TabA
MICDRIDNSERYDCLAPGISLALGALRERLFHDAPDGRYDIDGDRIFALVQRYTTRPLEKCAFESHRKYIDVQLVVSGEEAMGHAPVSKLTPSTEYDEAKDFSLYQPFAGGTRLSLSGGEFAVFYPSDGHMPCMEAGSPSPVVKIVVKVRVE